ncbi:MAG TPA: lysine exporter LysO family protein, partial [Thermoplasmata archaeon]|nr:lysine exporter LysO family protein [Thermoplasmata archaeon]
MVAIDPFLYVALAVGFLAGRIIRQRTKWIARVLCADIVLLVFLLGASVSSVDPTTTLVAVPLALGFAGLMLAVTVAVVTVTPHTPGAEPARTVRVPVPLGLLALGALVLGFFSGRYAPAIAAPAFLMWTLYALLALVGFDLHLERPRLRALAVPLTAAFAGALSAAAVFSWLARVPLGESLATSLAFGWYTLSGPVVATRLGATAGLIAFLTNFFRENLTMVFSPYLGRTIGAEGITAMGGATTMDTTLVFVTTYGEERAGTLALASGLMLT